MPRGTSYTVLLIEPDIFLRRLIALGLQYRGMRVIEARSLTALVERPIADPDVLILDINNGCHDDASLLTKVSTHPYLSALPMMILAWDEALPTLPATPPLLECLAKPFDARILHATVENLLETSAANGTSIRQVPAPSAALAISSSICPIATAAGLLLTVIGLMLQMLVAGLGLLVVLAALLWWTLGKHPERQVLLGEFGPPYAPSLP